MGRLKPGWSLERARAHLGSISPGLFEATLPKNSPAVSVKKYLAFKLTALGAESGLSGLRDDYSTSLWMLLAIAEGIESESQLASVRELGCDHAQGFLFAHPVPPEEISALLAAPGGIGAIRN